MITKLKLSVILCTLVASSSAFFTDWGDWSKCSKSCNGEQQRTRSCLTITLQPCGEKIQIRNCNASACYPSLEVIIICAVLGSLIVLLLIVLVIIIAKRRSSLHTHPVNETSRSNMFHVNLDKLSNDITQRNNEIQGSKSNIERTVSAVSQETYLSNDHDENTPTYGRKDVDLY